MNYHQKYLKYKAKYLNLANTNQTGGNDPKKFQLPLRIKQLPNVF